jgi:site-specific DNA recombinase
LLRLRASIADPSRAVGARPARRYLLSGGIAVCGRCGANLHAQRRHSGAPGYACVASPDKGGCGRLTVSAQPLEELVTEAVMLRLDTPNLAAEIGREAQDPEVVAKVAALEARLDELADLWAEGSIDRARWLRANQKINRDLEAARSRLARASRIPVLDGVIGDGVLRQAWPMLGLDRRRAIVSAVTEKVIVRPSSTRGRTFDPGRVDVIWRA